MIRRPGKNREGAKVYVVQAGKKQWVVDARWLATREFRFSGDVLEAPISEFDSMTTGDPIPVGVKWRQ